MWRIREWKQRQTDRDIAVGELGTSKIEMVLFLIPSREPPLDNLNEIKPIRGGRPNQTQMAAGIEKNNVSALQQQSFIFPQLGDISMYQCRGSENLFG
jgi:hypothetical protein